ncbi:MAG: glycosyltransferase family 1 protein [Xanthobacteraceae bacterium]|nr:glycosyltransferase family 1 protein [Xanthobacteraceae bacterium]
MKIFINGRFLSQPLTGVQRYAAEIVTAIDQLLAAGRAPEQLLRAEWELVAPPDAELSLSLDRIATRRTGRRHGHLWDQLDLMRAASGGMLISLANAGPVLHPDHLAVLHDAQVFRRPEFFGWTYRTLHRSLGRLLARRATIATVSNFSRNELASALHLSPMNIAVIPNSAEHFARTVPDFGTLDRLGIAPHRYFLLVGSMARNKNVALAVQAARDLARPDFPTVVVGGGHNQKIFAQNPVTSDQSVIFAGRLRDEEIAALYARATAFVFPSLYEGFGVPPLEAMAFGCPVIASTAEAVKETCGDAAVYFDPSDADALRRCMVTRIEAGPISSDERLRQNARLATYSWRKSAEAMLHLIAATKTPTS